MRRFLTVLSMTFIYASLGYAEMETKDEFISEQDITYEDIAPIMKNHCILCHQGSRPAARLNLTQFPFIKNHSEGNQKAIVERILVRVRSVEKPMPPRKPFTKPLNEEQIALIDAWLKGGLLE